MWVYIIGGFVALCLISFIAMAFIFYKAMKVNQRDELERKESASSTFKNISDS